MFALFIWWFGTVIFSIQLGMSSFQLTFIFFQRGWLEPPTSYCLIDLLPAAIFRCHALKPGQSAAETMLLGRWKRENPRKLAGKNSEVVVKTIIFTTHDWEC